MALHLPAVPHPAAPPNTGLESPATPPRETGLPFTVPPAQEQNVTDLKGPRSKDVQQEENSRGKRGEKTLRGKKKPTVKCTVRGTHENDRGETFESRVRQWGLSKDRIAALFIMFLLFYRDM